MNAVEEWEEDWANEDDRNWEDLYNSRALDVPLSKPTYSAILKG